MANEDDQTVQYLTQALQQLQTPPTAVRPDTTPVERSWLSRLGEALGGGTQIQMSPADRERAGWRALGDFGTGLMEGSGYYPGKAPFAAVASGFRGAERGLLGSQHMAASQLAAQQEYAKSQQEQQLARLKEALPILTTLGDYKRAELMRRLANEDPNARGAAAGSGAGTSVPRDPSIPTIGQQANNPGNLSHGVPGSTGYITAADGQKVGVFPDVATGVAAHADQLARYAEQGVRTPQDAVNLWVHGTLTPDKGQAARTAPYAAAVAAKLGVKPGDPINLADPAVQRAFILAQQPHESGKAWLSAGDVDKGLALAAARRQAAAGAPSAKPGAPPPPSAPRPSPSAATEAPDVAPTGVQFAGPGVPAAPADAGTVAEQPANQGLLNRLSAIGGTPEPAPAPGATAAADAIQAGRTGGVAGPDPTATPKPAEHPDIKAGDSVIRHPGTFQQYYDQNAQPVPKTEDFNPNLSREQLNEFAIKRAGLAREKKMAGLVRPGPESDKAWAAVTQKETALAAAEQEAIQAKRATADANITKHNNTQLERINPRFESEIKRYGDAAAAAHAAQITRDNKEHEVNLASKQKVLERLNEQAAVEAENKAQLLLTKELSDAAREPGFLTGQPTLRSWFSKLTLASPADMAKWSADEALEAATTKLVLGLTKGSGLAPVTQTDLDYVKQMPPSSVQPQQWRNARLGFLLNLSEWRQNYIANVHRYVSDQGLSIPAAEKKAAEDAGPVIKQVPKLSPTVTPEMQDAWVTGNLERGQFYKDDEGNMRIYGVQRAPPPTPARSGVPTQ